MTGRKFMIVDYCAECPHSRYVGGVIGLPFCTHPKMKRRCLPGEHLSVTDTDEHCPLKSLRDDLCETDLTM